MAGVCTSEQDPRPKVTGFISDPNVRSVSGNRSDGLDSLMGMIREEIAKHDPAVKVIDVNPDYLSERRILFARELGMALFEEIGDDRAAVTFQHPFSIVDWQIILDWFDDTKVQFYYGSLACGQVPLCVKLLRGR